MEILKGNVQEGVVKRECSTKSPKRDYLRGSAQVDVPRMGIPKAILMHKGE